MRPNVDSVLVKRLVGAAVLVVLLALPWLVNAYAISTVSRILVFAALAISVNLLTGVTGLPTLGQSAYFGVGAYTGAIVSTTLSDVGPVQLVLAAGAGAVAAAVTGPVAMRARGVAFLMITLAIGEIAYVAAGRLDAVTYGTDGYSGVPAVVPLPGIAPLVIDGLVYYYVLAVFLLLYGLVALLLRSPFGLALRGIRDNEDRLRAVGYPTTAFALAAYCIAGALAGAAGSMWTSAQRFVAPGDLGFDVAALALLAVIIGGLGSMWGASVGAALVVLTRDYLGGYVAGHGLLLLGVLFVVVVYALPRGLSGVRRPRRTPEVRT
ncbi:MAG: branched-chain amino acid ABC transporter permease [Nocardioidaceae bacterium]